MLLAVAVLSLAFLDALAFHSSPLRRVAVVHRSGPTGLRRAQGVLEDQMSKLRRAWLLQRGAPSCLCMRADLRKNEIIANYEYSKQQSPIPSWHTLLFAKARIALLQFWTKIKNIYFSSVIHRTWKKLYAPIAAYRQERAHHTVYVLELENGRFYVGSTGRQGRDKARRFQEHLSPRGGSIWTKIHRAIRVTEEYSVPRKYVLGFESLVTAQLMKKFGPNNVRGAQFSDPRDFDLSDVSSLTGFIGHNLEADYRSTRDWLKSILPPPSSRKDQPQLQAQAQTHNATQSGGGSKKGKDPNNDRGRFRQQDDENCFICGKPGHFARNCPAKPNKN